MKNEGWECVGMGDIVGIRVDANEVIAMGHLVRCMSIAVQLKRRGQRILFIISEKYSEKFIMEQGFECICLNNCYNEKNEEVEKLIHIIRERGIQKLLLDSYEVTFEYMSELKKYTELIYIDDIDRFRYPADIIINYVDSADTSRYSGKGYEKERFLLGSRYVPLRPEFADKRINIKPMADSIFVTTGGTDSYNMLIGILKKMNECGLGEMKKHVVAGKFYDKMDELNGLAAEEENIIVYHDIANMCEVMQKCDIAVSAGGTTMMELCACGVPIICFAMAGNQLPALQNYLEKGLVEYAGDVRDNREEVIDNIVRKIKKLKNNYALRETLSKMEKDVIDGKGAERIAECICNISSKHIH